MANSPAYNEWKNIKAQFVTETSARKKDALLIRLFGTAARLTSPDEYAQAFHSAEVFLFKDGSPITETVAVHVVQIALNDPVCAAVQNGQSLKDAQTQNPIQDSFLKSVTPSPGFALLKQLLDNTKGATAGMIKDRVKPSVLNIVNGMSPIVH